MNKIQKCVDSCMAASVGIHFVCCGLPVILALLGTAGTLISVPHGVMGGILIFSGLLLILSILMEIFMCNCNRRKWRIVVICICVVLYTIGLCGHFGVFGTHSSLTGEEIVLQCH
ncbi:MAG: hypothetical protein IJ560_03235 [Alphaproteobacteria bacterium]|nr:hypothetical protein [Alphaproteobacteria bacterium]